MYCGPEFLGWHGWFGFPFGWLLVGLIVWLLASHFKREKVHVAPMVQCTGCSRTIDPNWKFCPICGKSA